MNTLTISNLIDGVDVTRQEEKIQELEAENQRLSSELEVLETANEELALETVRLRDIYNGLEEENESLKLALKAVAAQLREGAEGIEEALLRIEGVEFN